MKIDTIEHIVPIHTFNRWVKKNIKNKAVYDIQCRVDEKNERIELNAGNAYLDFSGDSIVLYDVSLGVTRKIRQSLTIEKLLMEAVFLGVEKHFIETYQDEDPKDGGETADGGNSQAG